MFINADNKLGLITSSQRFKEEVKPMERASEMLYAFKPVTFRYKKAIDPQGILQFGLVAEDVEKVSPDLVGRDQEGNPYTVHYEQINAMLLNEFLKEHSKVEQQSGVLENQAHKIREHETTITALKKEMENVVACLKEQDSKIQKVSDRLEVSKFTTRPICREGPTPQIVQIR